MKTDHMTPCDWGEDLSSCMGKVEDLQNRLKTSQVLVGILCDFVFANGKAHDMELSDQFKKLFKEAYE